jgi:DNA-binding NtrC family response regulator
MLRAADRCPAVTAIGSLAQADRPAVLLIGLRPGETRKIADGVSADRWRTIVCSNANQAKVLLQSSPEMVVAAILLDQDANPEHAHHAVSALKRRDPRVPILVVGSSSASSSSIGAFRAGANQYLARPLAPDRIVQTLRSAAKRASSHAREVEPWAAMFAERIQLASLPGTAAGFQAALDLAAQGARGHGCVLIEGENGTGKDVLARAIHSASPRSQMQLRAINARGIAEAALESILFGHVRGAFVGAFESHTGLLRQCEGATLLLGDVDRLPVSVQERLAGALDERRVRPMGASHGFYIDVRVIALSDRRLSGLVKDGAFNARLYEKLAETRISLPALRERRSDIPFLARHFLRTVRLPQNAGSLTLDDEAISLLCRFDWPGNIRQLNEALLRAAARSRGRVLSADDFVEAAGMTCRRNEWVRGEQISERGTVRLLSEDGHVRPLVEIEADVIRLAIELYKGQMSEIARRLGMGRSTLYRRVADLNEDRTR